MDPLQTDKASEFSVNLQQRLSAARRNSPPSSAALRSHAERDAVDGAGGDPRIRLLPAHPEDHKGVGRDGGGGVEGFTQPTPRATLVHSDRHLQTHGSRKHDE